MRSSVLASARKLGGALALLSFAAPSFAQAQAAPADGDWEVIISPYLWAAGIEGSVSANGVESEFDADFLDIMENFDIAAMGALEMRHDRVNLTTNIFYFNLGADGDRATGSVLPGAPPGDFDVDLDGQMVIFELMPGYEVLSVSPFGDERRIDFDLRGGLRYWWFKNELDVELDPGSPLGPFHRDFESSSDWVDVIVGARMRAQLSQRFGLIVAGDVGGFELGDASDFTWSVNALLTFALGEHWQLAGGWRSIDFERARVDFRLEGPLLGAAYRF